VTPLQRLRDKYGTASTKRRALVQKAIRAEAPGGDALLSAQDLVNDINTWYDPPARRRALELVSDSVVAAGHAGVPWAKDLAGVADWLVNGGEDTDEWRQCFELLTRCRDAAAEWVIVKNA
jgi:hypothetical protein